MTIPFTRHFLCQPKVCICIIIIFYRSHKSLFVLKIQFSNNFHHRLSHCLKTSRTLTAMCTLSCVHWPVPILLSVFHTQSTRASKVILTIVSVFFLFRLEFHVREEKQKKYTFFYTHKHTSIYIHHENEFILYKIQPLLVRITNLIIGIIYVCGAGDMSMNISTQFTSSLNI